MKAILSQELLTVAPGKADRITRITLKVSEARSGKLMLQCNVVDNLAQHTAADTKLIVMMQTK